MKRTYFLIALFLLLIPHLSGQIVLAQIPKTISYQGVVTKAAGAVVEDGKYLITFKLYDLKEGGEHLWEEIQNVPVVGGIFNVILGGNNPLDLPFDQPYWLGIAIGGDAELEPRIELTAAAYSLNARSIADSVVTGSKIADGQVVRSINNLTDTVILAEGDNVTITPQGDSLVISATASPGGNITTMDKITATSHLDIEVNGGDRALRLENTDGNTPNVIGGFGGNSVAADVVGATIGGGGAADDGFGDPVPNRVTASFGTVAGGFDNLASGFSATVSGGENNTASTQATVGGGINNTASGSRATISGGVRNTADTTLATVSGGFFNLASGVSATVGGGTYNEATADFGTIAGGGAFRSDEGNKVMDKWGTVSGGRNNLAGNINNDPTDAEYATVGGGKNNTASGSGATIGGGSRNKVTDIHGTVGGGTNNQAGSDDEIATNAELATIGGGGGNEASGTASTIGGGSANTASGFISTVGGGRLNTAFGEYATVGGGISNTASGAQSTIPGGSRNAAAGDYSLAAGRGAKANHTGTFVWSDATAAAPADSFFSTGSNQFLVRASGGFGIGTTSPNTQLQVTDEINGNGNFLTSYVTLLENTSEGTSPDVLALKVGKKNPGSAANLIAFFGGDFDGDGNDDLIGEIQGDGAGGVEFTGSLTGGGGDYAEWLPRLRVEEKIEKGDIVGVTGGKVTKVIEDAHHIMVLTSRPIVLGNAPDKGEEHLYEKVAFLGQAPVKVRGIVKAGDFIMPSGLNDGVGIAISPDEMKPMHYAQIVGQAWESSEETGVRLVNTLVGLKSNHTGMGRLLTLLQEQQKEIKNLGTRLKKLEKIESKMVEFDRLKAKMAQLETAYQKIENIALRNGDVAESKTSR